jgi:hypothetical protein
VPLGKRLITFLKFVLFSKRPLIGSFIRLKQTIHLINDRTGV